MDAVRRRYKKSGGLSEKIITDVRLYIRMAWTQMKMKKNKFKQPLKNKEIDGDVEVDVENKEIMGLFLAKTDGFFNTK